MAAPELTPFSLADAERCAELATPILRHLAKAGRSDSVGALIWASAAVLVEYAAASHSTLDEALSALYQMTAQTAALMRLNFDDAVAAWADLRGGGTS